ncbi:MAG: histone deacetylase [Verrucomicrobia bacterium]|nr:histone deacetylase [Verrucomicrobiota bacterium]
MRCYYSPGYYLPLPDGHPFPMAKFPQAHGMLLADEIIDVSDIELVEPCAREHLERVHHPAYLDRIQRGTLTSKEATLLGLPPGPALYERSARETEGTRLAARAALADGLAANLAGGTHHAFADRGEGFCVLNDVAVSVRDLQREQPDLRVLVVDTDAHQGNGTHALLGSDPNVATYSIHVAANYPSRKVSGTLDVGLERYARGEAYLSALRATLPPLLERHAPDLVYWLSGADPHQNDRFGQLQLTLRDMQERDRLVLGWLRDRPRPLSTVVLYGGGYNREPLHTARLHRNSVAAACDWA